MPDPDLEIRGDPVIRSPKNFSSALRALVWSKNKGGGGADPQAPPTDPPLVKVKKDSLSVCVGEVL